MSGLIAALIVLGTACRRARPSEPAGTDAAVARPQDAAVPDSAAPRGVGEVPGLEGFRPEGSGDSPPASSCASLLAANEARLRRFFRRCPSGKRLYDSARGEEDFLNAHPEYAQGSEEARRGQPGDCHEIAGGYIGLRIRSIQVPESECLPGSGNKEGCSDEGCAERLASLRIKKTLVVSARGKQIEIQKMWDRGSARSGPDSAAALQESTDLSEELADLYEDPEDSRRLRLHRGFDFDGDGLPEVITQQDIRADCEAAYSIIRIWKIQGRQLVPYVHEPGAALREVRDGSRNFFRPVEEA